MSELDLHSVYDDLAYILRGIDARWCKKYVRKWTEIKCDNYHDVLLAVWTVFLDAYHSGGPCEVLFRDTSEFHAAAEIIEHSHLSQVIEHDDLRQCYRLRSDIPRALLVHVAKIVQSRTRGPANLHNVDMEDLRRKAALDREAEESE